VYIEIDLGTVPPSVVLEEPENFTAFKVVVREAEHVWVDPEQLAVLAGDLAGTADWRTSLQGMVRYASSKGWIREDGAIRAHVETVP
jgi:hypothetical protein